MISHPFVRLIILALGVFLLVVSRAEAAADEGLLREFWRAWRIPFFYMTYIPLVVVCLHGVGWKQHWRRLRSGEYNCSLLALFFFIALSVLFTWPLTVKCQNELVNWGDNLYLSYVLQHHMDRTFGPWSNYFDAPILYPLTKNVLARSEHIFGAFLMFSPIVLTTHNAVLGVNLMILTSFFLCGWFMYLYLNDQAGDEAGALLGGLLYGFCSYRIAHMPRAMMISCEFLPLCLLFFDRFVQRRRAADLWRFILACAMQMLMGGYWIVFMTYVLGAYCVAQLLRFQLWRDRRTLLLLCAASLWLALINLPWIEPYFALSQVQGDPWPLEHVREIAAKGSHYFCAPPSNWLYGAITRAHEQAPPGIQEGYLFCGMAALSLFLLGCWTRLAGKPGDLTNVWNRRLLLLDVGLVLWAILFLYPLLTNDFYLALPGEHLLHIPRLKTLFVSLLLIAGARIFLAWRLSHGQDAPFYKFDAQAWMFFVLIGLMFLFAFGPEINLGHHLWRNPLYLFAREWLPGVERVRSVNRVFFLILLFGSWFAVAGWRRIAEGIHNTRLRNLTALLLGLLIFLESAAMPFPGWNYRAPNLPVSLAESAMPDAYRELKNMSLKPAVVMLPMDKFWYDIYYMHAQKVHGATLANGYTGNFPENYEQFRQAMNTFPEAVALRAMRQRGVEIAVLHRTLVSADQWRRWIEYLQDSSTFTILYQSRDVWVVRLKENQL